MIFEVCEADVPTIAKRIYPRKVLELQIEKLEDAIKRRAFMGTLGIPENVGIIKISDISHVVTELFISDNKLFADIDVLNTPCGRVLQKFIDFGVKIKFRMSGVGNGTIDNNGNLVVDESFNLISIFVDV